MRTSIRTIMLAATCLAAILLVGNLGSPAFAAGQAASEPLSTVPTTFSSRRSNPSRCSTIFIMLGRGMSPSGC